MALLALIAANSPIVAAQTSESSGSETNSNMDSMMSAGTSKMDMSMMLRADSHAPVGVSGAELMAEGKWMISYSFARMEMDGNLDGTDSISPQEIATTVPNIFFGTPGQQPTLRGCRQK